MTQNTKTYNSHTFAKTANPKGYQEKRSCEHDSGTTISIYRNFKKQTLCDETDDFNTQFR